LERKDDIYTQRMADPPSIPQHVSEDAIASWVEPESFFHSKSMGNIPGIPHEKLQFPPGIPMKKVEVKEALHEKEDIIMSTNLSTSPTKVFEDNYHKHDTDVPPQIAVPSSMVSGKETAHEIDTVTHQSTNLHQSPSKVRDTTNQLTIDSTPHSQELPSLPSPTHSNQDVKIESIATATPTIGELHPSPSPLVTHKYDDSDHSSPHSVVDVSSPLKRQSKLPSPKREKEYKSTSLIHDAPDILLHDDHHDHENLPKISKPHKNILDASDSDFREEKIRADRNHAVSVAKNIALYAAASSYGSATDAFQVLRDLEEHQVDRKQNEMTTTTTDEDTTNLENQIEILRESIKDQVRRQEYLLRFRDSVTTKRQIATLREELESYFRNISFLETSRDESVKRLDRVRLEIEDRSNRVIEKIFMLTARDSRIEMKHKHWLAATAVHSAVTRQGKKEVKMETKRILQDTSRLHRVSLERFRNEHRAKFPYLNIFELEKWVHFSKRRFASRKRELMYIQNLLVTQENGHLRDSIRSLVSNFQSVMERLMRYMQHLRHHKSSPSNLSESNIHAAFLTTTDEFLPINERAFLLYENHYRDLLHYDSRRRRC